MMHGKAIQKSGISEIAKTSRDIYSTPYELPADVLMHVWLWTMAIKVNPS